MNDKIFIIGAVICVIGIFVFASIYSSNSGLGSRPDRSSSGVRGSVNDTAPTQNRNQNLAPDFELELLGGGTITLSQFRGEKPVILDFFTTWCPNCQRDMPKLSKWYDKYKDQVEVIGIDIRENKGTVQDFVNSRGISFPIALDSKGQAANTYGIRYTNTHILIDKYGSIVREIPGDIRESDIKSLIQ